MNKKNKGFTLLEIIAVIVIIGIIIVISGISVTNYIEKGKAKTYESFAEDLRVATNDYMINCFTNNEEDCIIPEKGNDLRVTYDELVNKGYSEPLKDPEGDGYCDRSYVIVKNTDDDVANLEYKVCLYCDKNKIEEGCDVDAIDDKNKPVCDYTKLSGASTEWTKENKEITIGCKDNGSGCSADTYTVSFGQEGELIEKGQITISDNVGNKENCEVDVYVDRKKPTCELEIVGTGYNGWYQPGAIVQFKNYGDEGSGVLATGIAKSGDPVTYGSNSYTVTQNGISTIVGYVKDKVGNVGSCSVEVKVDGTAPTATIYMGYEIYPKETTTISGTQGTINDLSKYGDVEGIIVYFSENIAKNLSGKIYSNGISIKTSGSILSGRNKAIFKITKGTYSSITFDIEDSIILSKITKVELLKKESVTSVWTNKDISVYVDASDQETGIDKFSYDSGSTYIEENIKSYSSTHAGTIYVTDKAGNTSVGYEFNINKIDKIKPKLNYELTANGEEYTSNKWTKYDISRKLMPSDTGGSGYKEVQYQSSCSGSWYKEGYVNLYTMTTEGINNACYKAIDNAGNESDTIHLIMKVDKTAPYTSTLDIDYVWSVNNVSNGTEHKTVYDVYCEVDGQTIYPTGKGGAGTNALKNKTTPINCYIFVVWDNQSSTRTLRYIRDDLGSSGVNSSLVPHRFGAATYIKNYNHHTWGLVSEHINTDTYHHGGVRSKLSGCTNVNVTIEQEYAVDRAGNRAANLLTEYTVSGHESSVSQTTKMLNCLHESTYYFTESKHCVGKNCYQYDLPE